MTCNKPDCGATVMLSVMGSKEEHFNRTTDCLDLICPACNRAFSISIFKLEWSEVNEKELGRGFSGLRRVQSLQPGRHIRPVSEGALTVEPAGLQLECPGIVANAGRLGAIPWKLRLFPEST